MASPLVLLLLLVPALLGAQRVRVVDPSMTRAQVVAALGEPAAARTAKEFTYLFYQNGCGRRCGMNDLVVLQRDSVVDAIFRAPDRRFSGASSSPSAIPPAVARRVRPVPSNSPSPQ